MEEVSDTSTKLSTQETGTTGPAGTVAELIEYAEQNPIKWLIPGILIEGGTHIVHGKESSFKTMLTLQMHEALALGGEFLMREVQGGLRTGVVELEEKPRLFGQRLLSFFRDAPPSIQVLPEHLRFEVLNGKHAKDRIGIIVDWASEHDLEVISIDSAVKLFPPYFDLSRPDLASEVFNQLQRLRTLWLIAHDRKSERGGEEQSGNDEIVGSGRFAQDPDVIHQMVRSDRRSPMSVFECGKMREGEQDGPLELWFDKVDFRLRPLHPFIHLLRTGPQLEADLIAEATERYGWRERRARDHIKSLGQLRDASGQPVVSETQQGHKKLLTLVGKPVPFDPDDEGY